MEANLELRAGTLNSCACCGLLFTSEGGGGNYAQLLDAFEGAFVESNRSAFSCLDRVQGAHLLHRLQRVEGWNCFAHEPEQEEGGGEGGEEGDEEGDDEGDEEGGDEDAVEAEPNFDYETMSHLSLDKVLRRLVEVMEEDKNGEEAKKYAQFEDEEEPENLWSSVNEVVVPACIRCNTLMTLQQKTTDILVALGGLESEWYDSAQRKHSNKLRRRRYALLIRKSVEKAEETIRNTGHDLVGEGTIPREALVTLTQLLFLSMAASVACVPSRGKLESLQPFEHFRMAGIRRLYLSSVMWTLCRIRWPRAMEAVSFLDWHINYAEHMPFTQRRSWHKWLFADNKLVRIPVGKKRVDRGALHHMLSSVLEPALVNLMQDVDEFDIKKMPTLWQMMKAAIPDYVSRYDTEFVRFMMPTNALRVFPPHGYFDAVRDLAIRNTPRLNVDSWARAFGKYLLFRRMVTTAVFHMSHRCAVTLLEGLGAIEGNVAPPGLPDNEDLLRDDDGFIPEIGEGEVDSNLLELYQSYLYSTFAVQEAVALRHLGSQFNHSYGNMTRQGKEGFSTLKYDTDSMECYDRVRGH